MSDARGEATVEKDRVARKAARKQALEARKIPLAALTLGAAGLLLPFIAVLARLAGESEAPITGILILCAVAYILMILSFLGGIWWGIASVRAKEEQQPILLVIAVLPTIIASALFMLAQVYPVIAALLLTLVIALTPLVDARLKALGLVPAWWMRLRVPLSLALAAITLAIAGLLML